MHRCGVTLREIIVNNARVPLLLATAISSVVLFQDFDSSESLF